MNDLLAPNLVFSEEKFATTKFFRLFFDSPRFGGSHPPVSCHEAILGFVADGFVQTQLEQRPEESCLSLITAPRENPYTVKRTRRFHIIS